MIAPEVLKKKLQVEFPNAQVDVEDLTGGMDHYRVSMVWSGFAGLTPIARHRLVHGALREELKGPIHALTLHLRDRTIEADNCDE